MQGEDYAWAPNCTLLLLCITGRMRRARSSGEKTESMKIAQENYLGIEREWRRAHGKALGDVPEVSDSDDDVNGSWRFRRLYRHVDGCKYPSRRG
jgi:hypothetical protein